MVSRTSINIRNQFKEVLYYSGSNISVPIFHKAVNNNDIKQVYYQVPLGLLKTRGLWPRFETWQLLMHDKQGLITILETLICTFEYTVFNE